MKYGEEERRRTRAKDASMARADSSDRPWITGLAASAASSHVRYTISGPTRSSYVSRLRITRKVSPSTSTSAARGRLL